MRDHTEQQEQEAILAEYKAYCLLCEGAGLEPVPLGGQYEMIAAMWALGRHVIPYISSTNSVWVHDLRHKTTRRDRPWAAANMEALGLAALRKRKNA